MDLATGTTAATALNKENLDEVFGTALAKTKGDGVREGAESDYRVKLPVFDGPLDLLLHLIRKEQLNIYDIPVAQICSSYLQHLELLQQPDCNIAGEFFVMAASLVQLKSQMLLPQEERALDEDDPRLPLVAQLLEYERFKRAAVQIDQMPWLDRDLYARPMNVAHDIPVESLLDAPIEQVETFALLVCLKSAMDRTTRPPMKIDIDTTSLKEKVIDIGNYLAEQGIIDFRRLIPEGSRRIDVVVSFMAILELAKLKYIEILQTENFGPIQVRQVKSVRDLNMEMLDQF